MVFLYGLIKTSFEMPIDVCGFIVQRIHVDTPEKRLDPAKIILPPFRLLYHEHQFALNNDTRRHRHIPQIL